MKGGGRGGGHSRASGGERSRSQTQHRRRQLCTFCQPSIRSRRGLCRNRIGIGIESSRYRHTKPKRPPPPARRRLRSKIKMSPRRLSGREGGRKRKKEDICNFADFSSFFLRVCCGFAKKTNFSAFVLRFFPPFLHGVHFKGRGNALLLCLDKEKLLSAALRATSFVRFSVLR